MDFMRVAKSVTMRILLTSLITIVTSTSGFPSGCKDTSNQSVIDCSHSGLTDVPSIDGQALSVDLSWNNLDKIESLNLPSLTFLNLSNNAISHLHALAFNKLASLKVLDLSFNLISGDNLTRQTFKGMKSLEKLYLEGNPLRILPKGTLHFMDLEVLELVDLSYCRLTRIEKDSMSDIGSLKSLYLKGNELVESDLDLGGFSFLEIFEISGNPLRRILDKPFFYMIHLTRLSIESCQLTVLGENAFDGLFHLTYLSLNNNSLETLDMRTFLPLIGLEELILSRNPIKVIDANTFDFTNKNIVRILKLEFMPELKRIGENSFQKLDSLKILYLSNNRKLMELEENALLISSGYLQIVNLDNNSLSNIPKGLLDWKSIRWVSLHGNPWYCDCKLSWVVFPVGPINKTTPIMCQGPAEHRGLNLLNIPPDDLGCFNRATKIALGVLLLVGICVLVTVSAYFIIRWRKKGRYTLKDLCCFLCTRGKGERYISVYQNDDVEPFASITFSEEEDKSKSAVPV